MPTQGSAKARTTRHRRVLPVLALLAVLFIAWTIWGNVTIAVTRYEPRSARLPEAFDGFTIVQISDLHNARFGADNARLVERVRDAAPDLIALTGDLVDAHHTDIDIAMTLVRQLVAIAPCYYVSGNHEAWLGADFESLEAQLREAGVNVLRNEATTLRRADAELTLIGLTTRLRRA